MPRSNHLLAGLALSLIGCAALLTIAPTTGFSQTLGKAHPLAGRIYKVSANALVSRSKLEDALASAERLRLGETHDNRDHHWLEATLVGEFLDAHGTAAIGFEM